MRTAVAVFVLLLGFVAAASACTVCDSDLGEQVRAGIFEENFWRNLFAVVAPFPTVLLAVAVVQRGLFRGPNSKPASAQAASR